MGMLSFFPWLDLAEPAAVGGFDVAPLLRGEALTEMATQEREAIDLLLEPYVVRGSEPVEKFAVMKLNSMGWLDELDDAQRREHFDFAELLAFSSLAARTFFPEPGLGLYTNRAQFQLYIQRFEDPKGGVAVESRRRDGSNTNFVPRDSYRVHKPEHIVGGWHVPLDLSFLEALISSRAEGWWPPIWEGVLGYNLANTDSTELGASMELVLLNGAFERAFDLGHGRAKDLAVALISTIVPTERKSLSDCSRVAPLPAAGKTPKGEVVMGAWVHDLFDVRNDLAHGKAATQDRPIWEAHEHLLLGSVLFPLVVKTMLAERAKYEMTERDLELIDAFEELACEDLFRQPKQDVDGVPQEPWAWNRVISNIQKNRRNARIVAMLEAAHEAESDDDSLGEEAR